jgi:RNA polymerase sigma-70 factor (ECF subfamily)
VQKTIIDATAAADRFDGQTEPAFSAWIHQILRRNIANAVRDHRAAKRDVRRETFAAETESSATLSWQVPDIHQTTASQRVIRSEAALNLARGLERLPDDQRRAVIMRHLDGLPLNEIAAAMDKTPASVAGLIRRGVTSLRGIIPDTLL